MRFSDMAKRGAAALIVLGLASATYTQAISIAAEQKSVVEEEPLSREELREEIHGYLDTLAKTKRYASWSHTVEEDDYGKIEILSDPILKLAVVIDGYKGWDKTTIAISKYNKGFDDLDCFSIESVNDGRLLPKHEWVHKKPALEKKMDEILSKARLGLKADVEKMLREREENKKIAFERLDNIFIPTISDSKK